MAAKGPCELCINYGPSARAFGADEHYAILGNVQVDEKPVVEFVLEYASTCGQVCAGWSECDFYLKDPATGQRTIIPADLTLAGAWDLVDTRQGYLYVDVKRRAK